MNKVEEISWSQKYRPPTIQDCILPNRLKVPFQKYVDDKIIPNLTLAGTPGVGKTTVVLAMLKEIGCDYLKINGSSENGIDTLRTKITNYAATHSMNGMRKVILIDEADYLTPECQAGLRNVMEEFSHNCSFILTCNFKSKLIDAIHSRAPIIEFRLIDQEKVDMAIQLLSRIKDILSKENVSCENDSILIELIKKYFPDYRKTLNILQHHAAQSGNNIKSDILSDGIDKGIQEVLEFMKDKKVVKVRQWVAKYGSDAAQVYRSLYDQALTKFSPNTFADSCMIIADWQYKSAFAADQEICLMGCLVDLMKNVQFK